MSFLIFQLTRYAFAGRPPKFECDLSVNFHPKLTKTSKNLLELGKLKLCKSNNLLFYEENRKRRGAFS